MKRLLTTCAIAAVAFLSSCKKDKSFDLQQEKQPYDLKANKMLSKPEGFNFQTSDAALKADTKKLVDACRASIKQGAISQRPGHCPLLVQSSSIFVGTNPSYSCMQPATTLVFQVSVIESPAYNYQLDYSFDLYTGAIFPATGTFALQNVTELCPIWNPNGQSGECPLLKVFEVTFTIDTREYEKINSATVGVNAICQQPGSSPTNLFNLVSIDYPCSEYVISPAIIYVNPSVGSFDVGSQCTIICHDPHFACPIDGTFNYRLLPNGSWQSVNLPWGNIFSHPAAPGNYEYSCTLNYSCGTTLPATGIFIVF